MQDIINKGIGVGLALIGILVGLYLVATFSTTLFALIVTAIVSLSTLGNFTFASLFTSSGVFVILLSVVILLAMLGIVVGGVYYAVKGTKGKR